MINATAQTLLHALQDKGVAITLEQSLDLLAAATGQPNRHVLATLPALPCVVRVNENFLQATANVIAAGKDKAAAAIVAETAKIVTPNAPRADAPLELEGIDIQIYPEEVEDPSAFFATDRGWAYAKIVAQDLYYSRYYCHGNHQGLDKDEANRLGQLIIEAKYAASADECQTAAAEGAIAEFFSHGEAPHEYWHYFGRDEVKSKLSNLEDAINDLDVGLKFNMQNWLVAISDLIQEIVEEKDDSSPQEMIASHDECEVVFVLKPKGVHNIDAMTASTKNYPDFSALAVDRHFQHVLASLGYTISEYRKFSGNKITRERLRPGLRKRQEPLLPMESIREIVDNACSTYFNFVIYGLVPVKSLVDLDLTKPITFSSPRIATYDHVNGTFMDVPSNGQVTLHPSEGELVGCTGGMTPDAICGFVRRYIRSDISNAEDCDAQAPVPLAA